MTDHYYSSAPSSKVQDLEFQAVLLGHSFIFQTNSGVFSKKGIDFGSRLLIETVEIGLAHTILDLGCGYGSIGVAIAKAYPHTHVTMVDINHRAMQLAQINAEKNGVADRVECVESNGFYHLQGKKFDQILFNPPIRQGKEIIYRLFSEAKEYLVPKGSFWIVIRKQQGARSTFKELQRIYDEANFIEQKKGYCIIQAFKQ